MSVLIKLGQDVVWGTTTAGSSALGKIVSVSHKKTAEKFEQKDEDDELYSLIIHDQRSEVTMDIVVKAASALPSIGDTLTIAGVTDMLVMDAEEKWTAGDTKKFTVTAMKSTA